MGRISSVGRGTTETTQAGMEVTLLDDFETTDGWKAFASDGAKAKVGVRAGISGQSVCLDYELGHTHGYALISKELPMDLPANFEFVFFLRQDTPQANMEFKLIDPDGNTFMKKIYSLGSPNRWKKMVVRKDDILWAWGPARDAPLKQIRRTEFVVTGASRRGRICIDRLMLRPLPAGGPHRRSEREPWAGYVPRWLSEEQAYWTIVGAPEDENEAIICEDGTIEPLKRGFSVLPLLHMNGRVVSRNDARLAQSLEDGHLPVPAVDWRYGHVAMRIQLYAHGKAGESSAYAKYSIRNEGTRKVSGNLLLLVQPYQVYPPWQGGGGFSPIQRISYDDGVVKVNGRRSIWLLSAPDDFRAYTEDQGPGTGVQTFDTAGEPFAHTRAEDADGFAAGLIRYHFDLRPNESQDFYVVFPLHDREPDMDVTTAPSEVARRYEERLRETIEYWQQQVNRVGIRMPEQAILDTFKANIAYNLITRDGPALQPGSRSYDKAWMRDGSIAAVAMLQVGQTQVAMDFARWYAGYQRESGEVPPIIDTKAQNPLWEEDEKGLVEYDSQGEFVWLIAQCYDYTRDRSFLEEMFPHVIKALQFTQYLRRQRLTPEYRDAPPEKRVFYGILPPSTSHEGYDMKHSYWDDFWALKGWEEARRMAEILGRTDLLPWIDKEYADFRKCVYDSISLVSKIKKIDCIPGCAELGDIDPTSTAASIVYCDQLANMPREQLNNTFDYFYEKLKSRLEPDAEYRFTPYETRSISAYIRLGRKERALQLLRFILACRRPPGWNHLAEVVHSDERFPTYIGDMPHTWVGAEFIIAVRNLFAYEDGGTLVLGAGIDPVWLKDGGEPIGVEDLPTRFGNISYEMWKEGRCVRVHLSGQANPPGGLLLKSPLDEPLQAARLNGITLDNISDTGITIRKLPADVVLVY